MTGQKATDGRIQSCNRPSWLTGAGKESWMSGRGRKNRSSKARGKKCQLLLITSPEFSHPESHQAGRVWRAAFQVMHVALGSNKLSLNPGYFSPEASSSFFSHLHPVSNSGRNLGNQPCLPPFFLTSPHPRPQPILP